MLTTRRAILSLILASTCASACASTGAKRHALRAASDLANPPFAWVDEMGLPRGRDVEMMQTLARALGRTLTWERMEFDLLLEACEHGEVDLVCATLGATPERAQRVRLSRPYYATTLEVVVPDQVGAVTSLAELAGRRVLASPGTTSERALQRLLPHSKPVVRSKSADAPAERPAALFASGAIDAAIMDGPAARALVANSGGRLKLLTPSLEREDYVLALPRSQHGLQAELDRELERLEKSGELERLNRAFGL